MMHHPNMHHQPMSGHPPQHMPTHQGMPAHHQMPPHQMHRENRVGFGGNGGGMGGGGVAAPMGVHHAPAPRPPHAIRGVHHPAHAQAPQQMKPLRRPYNMNPGYGHMMPPPYAAPPPPVQSTHTVIPAQPQSVIAGVAGVVAGEGAAAEEVSPHQHQHDATPPDCEARSASQANSKEKTPMCLVNELARYNKIKHQYRLTSETGPAHKKVFTVTLRLGDTEEYTAEGSSIKRAQHAAASAALAGTAYPPPPARAAPSHPPHSHHRHAGAVMPTVELNALAMKLCQPAVYTSIVPRVRPPAPYRMHPPFVPNNYQRMLSPGLVYRVRVTVGDRAWLGEGATPQAARHDAAARALQDLRQPSDSGTPVNNTSPPEGENVVSGETNADLLNSEVKSPVSLVHELALKRNLSVLFTVKSERGPPHMRVFVTLCTVGELETEGEGNGKKVSKRRAAEKMLEEMRRTWPAALLRSRPVVDKRRTQLTKKKPRNLIKEGGVGRVEGEGGADNPISRLAMARHAARARSPQYRVLEERGAARRREFLVQCDAPPYSATGLGPNKKTAKRRAAHNVLLSMEMNGKGAESTPSASNPPDPPNGADVNTSDAKRKDAEGGAAGEVRQPVPGVLMMDYHQRSPQPQPPNGVSETSATGGSGGNTPGGAKDQLIYLAQLLGFTVQFSDFPKRNHGEYLSLVSLSTEPPVMCHGGGPSTAHSHEQCSRAALRALAMMGLDAPPHAMQTMPGPGTKPGVISNGISE